MKRMLFALMILAGAQVYCGVNNISSFLQKSFIYSSDKGNAVVFRKDFSINREIKKAAVHIFADSYYALYINDRYILSGPSRFDPKRPEYDSLDVSKFLSKGKNSIAVLVYGGISSGMRMRHQPGFTMAITADGIRLVTDETWKCSSGTRFKEPLSRWNGIIETIDASAETGDCLSTVFDDKEWKNAVRINGNAWGKLQPRILPLLDERSVKAKTEFSFPMDTGSFTVEFDKNYLLIAEMDFEAVKGTEIKINEFKYTAKQGRQKFRTYDSFGITDAKLKIEINGKIKLHNISFINRVYPFIQKGSFECSDTALTRLWQISVHTLQQCTEDGYQDCPWERAEWMGDAAVVEHPLTLTAFSVAGNIKNRQMLMKKMLNDIALSQDSLGRIKAHHPSDRFDIHAYIEDYSCLWIESLRDYFSYTNDIKFLRDMYPVMKRLLTWFVKQIGNNGLVKGREFYIFDNPLLYKIREGATLNASVYKALRDGEYIAEVMKDKQNAEFYKKNANSLFVSFNKVLWNEKEQTYNASSSEGPNYHSAFVPLDRGIVPEERIPAVEKWFFARYREASASFFTYTHFWLLKMLFSRQTAEWDINALDIIRARYKKIYSPDNIGFTSGENFKLERPFHNFGSSAAYSLSANVLGVTTRFPLTTNQINIKPQLGDLSFAKGTVVTEQGPVDVYWKIENNKLFFEINIPAGKKAVLYLPINSAKQELILNSKSVKIKADGKYGIVKLTGGNYTGIFEKKN